MSKVNPTGNTKTRKRLLELKGAATLRVFAAKCGINQNTMHNYLHGRKLDEKMIRKICAAFGKSSDWLLGIKEMTPIDDATMKLKMLVNEAKAHSAGMDKFIKTLGV